MRENIESVSVPESFSRFAKMVAEAAVECGVEKFNLNFEPEHFACEASNSRQSGPVNVSYAAKDGRGRPQKWLVLTMDVQVRQELGRTKDDSHKHWAR